MKHLKILYVDDEPDIQTIVELALGMDPTMNVTLASSGDEALEIIDKAGWVPDMALVDMMMPGMTGIELLNAFRELPKTSDMPVLFITASARSLELNRYVEAGAIGVISKPFEAVTLARLVRRHYEDWAASDPEREKP